MMKKMRSASMKSDDDDDDDDDDDEEDEGKKEPTEADDFDREEWDRKKKVESGRDVEEGRTVFLRNVDFSIDENALSDFSRNFGEVVLSRVVYDRSTGHSKGCAFVQFKTADGAKKCLEEAAENGGLRLGQQNMVVNLALPKKEAKKMTNEAQKMEGKQPKDKRNLYLAREGFIRPGSDAAEGVSTADMNRRMKLISLKKQKLKNTNFFISDTRLSVHNLPATWDEKKLKHVFIEAMTSNGVKGARVTECRIMRDGKRPIGKTTVPSSTPNAAAMGKSKGFGFVAFEKHEHALIALRHTNNNPSLITESRRLIVEFSVENSKALQIKEKRKERIKTGREQRENASIGKQPSGRRAAATDGKGDGSGASHSGFKAVTSDGKGDGSGSS